MKPPISFRTLIHGAVSEFLHTGYLNCAETQRAVSQLVSALSSYSEEGVALFPEVVVSLNVSDLAKQSGGADIVRLGRASLSVEGALFALKVCAPLADGGWVMFLERHADRQQSLPLPMRKDDR